MPEPHNNPTELAMQQSLAALWPIDSWSERRVVIAVSGGADSVALARLIHSFVGNGASGENMTLAHFNHGLRGEASDGDEAFVAALASQLGVKFVSQKSPFGRSMDSPGVENHAREERYEFLKDLAHHWGARFVLTAHHAEDQAETIIHRIARGTSVAGLAGIRPFRELDFGISLVRPLLHVRAKQIRSYLSEINQDFRQDASNRSLYPTRNRIRLKVLPLLEEIVHPEAIAAICRLGQTACEYHELLTSIAKPLADECSTGIDGGFKLELKQLNQQSELVQRQVLFESWRKLRWPVQDMSSEKWRLIVNALNQQHTDFHPFELPGKIRVERDEDYFYFVLGNNSGRASD